MESNTTTRDHIVSTLVNSISDEDYKLLINEYAGEEEGDRDIMGGDISSKLATKIEFASELLEVAPIIIEWELIRTLQAQPQDG